MDELQEIVEGFILETAEILERLDRDLTRLEGNPGDLELLNEIFRSAHTIKGTSSFLGFTQLTELAHKMEDVLNRLRHEGLRVTPEIMDVLLEAVDHIKVLLEGIKVREVKEVDLCGIMGKLTHILEAEGEASEKGLALTQVEEPRAEEAIREEAEPPGAKFLKSRQKSAKDQSEQTIRVDVERLDNLMNLIGELVLSRNRLAQLCSRMEEEYRGSGLMEQLNEVASRINFITSELQMAVMRTRMLPIGKVFNKFPRIVRDLVREKGKEVELVITGEDTELDKSVVDEINDPLVHLIRNAIDHGIEPPEERVRLGKPYKGTVKLYAYHEGSYIVIGIEDDGRGMDVEQIKRKAVEKGLVTRAEVARMGFQDALNLIFTPGFSTAEQITDVSGRGVGMDVVKTTLVRLNGMIEINTKLGVGSRIILKLPLTLAIIQGLLVEVGKELFIIPLASVLETTRITPDQVRTVNQQEVILLRDRPLPIIRLGDLFRLPFREDGHRWLYVVVVGLAEKQYGLVVNAIKGQEEAVIKPLGKCLDRAKGVAGATIMGNGRVRLILDIVELIELAQGNGGMR